MLQHFRLTFDQQRHLVTLVRSTDGPVVMEGRRSTGLSFRRFPNYWRLLAVVPDTPNSELPVQPGDLCVRINGEPVPVVAMNDPCIEEATSEYPVLLFAEPSGLFLLPEPTVGVPIDLMLAVAPGFLSTEAPDLLWQRHSEAMLHGALSRLLAEPGKVWSNPQFAGYCRQMFDAEITKQAALYGRNRITNAQWLRSRPA